MRSLNFSVEGGRDNVINIPVDNPSTATTGRLLVDTGNGMSIQNDVTVIIDGDLAVVTIPATLASQMYNVRWVLQAFEGTTPVSVAAGSARLTSGANKTVEIANEIEIANATGAALPVAIPGTVNLTPGQTILTSSSIARKEAEGKLFVAGKAITAGGALTTARPSFRLFNPAGSGKTLFVFFISIYSDVSQQIVYREGATLSGATAVTPRQWNPETPIPSVATVEWSATAPTGGTQMVNESRVFNTAPLGLSFPAPHRVIQGGSFTIDFQSSSAQTTTANAYWYEE